MIKDLNNFLTRIGIIPRFTEISLFLMTITLLLIALTADSDLRNTFFDFFFDDDGKGLFILSGIIAGMILSVYYAFSTKPISEIGKVFLLFFAVLANAIAGFTAGEYALKNATGIFIIFPALNMASAFILLLLWRGDFIDTSCISNEQAKKFEVIFGSITVACLFFISHFILHNFWAITFSFCIVYATNINEIIYNLFKNNQNLPKLS